MPAESPPALPAGPVVVDASAVVEYVVVLTLTDAATRLFRRAGDGSVELWAPDLIYPESASALRRLVQLQMLDVAPARRALEMLTRLPIMITGTAGLMQSVWNMRAFLSSYDACYVALAEQLGGTYVTAERDLARELRKRKKRAHYLGDV